MRGDEETGSPDPLPRLNKPHQTGDDIPLGSDPRRV
jgi:hypothetical protein